MTANSTRTAIASMVVLPFLMACGSTPASSSRTSHNEANNHSESEAQMPEDTNPTDETPPNQDSNSETPSDSSDAPPPENNDDSNDNNEEPNPDSPAPDAYADRPAGQCVQNSDCPTTPNGQNCNRSFPGGSCSGCGTDAHCPNDTICHVGTCVKECNSPTECPPGLYCLSSGRCGASWCVDNACPINLFGCSASNKCERKSCDTPTDCPDQTTCVSGVCIENRSI